MKITFCGNYKFPWCSEMHFSKTLEKLNHTLIRLQEDEVNLEKVVEVANNSDLFFWTRTYGMMKFDGFEMLKRIKVPTVSVHLDLYFKISRQTAMNTDPFWSTDYVFQPDGDNLKEFKDMGINAYFSPPAVFEEGAYLLDMPKTNDVIFVGSWREYHAEHPWRREMVQKLMATYPTFDSFPKPPDFHAVREEALNRLYAETKVVAGDSLHLPGNKTYTTDRIFETTGRGGFILYPRIEFLEKIFPSEIFYESGNFDDLKNKIDYYLKNDEEREELRKVCHEITKKDHTYTVRFKKILEIIENEKNNGGTKWQNLI